MYGSRRDWHGIAQHSTAYRDEMVIVRMMHHISFLRISKMKKEEEERNI